MNKKPILLHICNDYPDAIRSSNKTEAVSNLVKHINEFDHVVFSLNRTSRVISNVTIRDGSLYSIKYWGLPWGIGLKFNMERVARAIVKIIEQNGIVFDIVHAHKLTIEGIAGYYISRHFGKPLVCTIRGQTDLMVIHHKPLYKQLFTDILEHSSHLFFLAPWTLNVIGQLFSVDVKSKSGMLPNIVFYVDPEKRRQAVFSNRFITAVRFGAKNFKSKHLDKTLQAFDMACRSLDDIHLDIAGSGASTHQDEIDRLFSAVSHTSRIHLIGQFENEKFCAILPDYAAFVRPSYPETFGMVFIEALFAGLPVLHAKNTGIDGYYSDADFAVAVDHRSIVEIADGMITLFQNQMDLKCRLNDWLDTGSLKPFLKENIVNTYIEKILRVMREK